MKEFAAVLLRRMRLKGLSATEVGERSGLRAETIRSYVQARNRPSKSSMRRLQGVLGTDIAKTFGDTELSGSEESAIRFVSVDGINAMIEIRATLPIRGALEVFELLRKYGVTAAEMTQPSDDD